jgi:hypothetical protein
MLIKIVGGGPRPQDLSPMIEGVGEQSELASENQVMHCFTFTEETLGKHCEQLRRLSTLVITS